MVETVFTASTHDYILFFTSKGRVYRKKGYQIPEAGRTAKGTNIVNILQVESDEKVTAMIHLREYAGGPLSRSGHTQRDSQADSALRYRHRTEGGNSLYHPGGGRRSHLASGRPMAKQCILIATHDGMAICFLETDVRCMGRDAYGVRGIHLRDGDYVVGAARAKYDHQVLMVTENGYGKRTEMDEYIRADGPQRRGGFGLKGYQCTEKTGKLAGVKVVNDGDGCTGD